MKMSNKYNNLLHVHPAQIIPSTPERIAMSIISRMYARNKYSINNLKKMQPCPTSSSR